VVVLEMTDPSQSQRDKILWEQATRGRMKKKDLRQYTRLKLSELEPILEDLTREGRIRIETNMIGLK
jgi:hypothetical protein